MADKSSPLTPSELTRLRTQLQRELKRDMEDFVREEVKRALGTKAQRDQVQEMTLDVLLKFYRQLANRGSFFKNM